MMTMFAGRLAVSLLMTGALATAALAGDDPWVQYSNDTSLRLSSAPEVGVDDPDEKDYAWGDVDLDGDVDLVVVRKQPWSSPGRRRNVLWLNEGVDDGHPVDGVLVDRTEELASDADDGGAGMLDLTNDRDVALADVNNDGWLDIITATTLSDGLPKSISHPRVYINKGTIDGAWQGFRYETGRIPEIHPSAGPRFNAVAVGDVTGDGFVDLYFVDNDLGGQQVFDYNDRLLINDGRGFFSDQSAERMTEEMLTTTFAQAAVIIDMNGDGAADIVRSSNGAPVFGVTIAYNDPNDIGVFDGFDVNTTSSPTHVSAGDLNGDSLPDLVVTDDGTDRFLLNVGNGPDGFADFTTQTFGSSTNGFGGNSVIADLDNDGAPDVVIADIDFEIPGCNRTTSMLRSNGDGLSVTFADADGGSIADDDLKGVHDVAIFDLDGDGRLDMVLGRCGGTDVYTGIGFGLQFDYPEGRPEVVAAGESTAFEVLIAPDGVGDVVPGSALLHVSIDGGDLAPTPLEPLGGDLYLATLPPAACGARLAYYLEAASETGRTTFDPVEAPLETYTALATDDTVLVLADDLEGGGTDWSVENGPSLVSGAWEAVEPIGTVSGGDPAAPDADATPGGVIAFVTENGVPGGSSGDADVDGGPTRLVSPAFDVDGYDAIVSYARWFFCNDVGTPTADVLHVEVSSDGGPWVSVEEVTSTGSAWETASFRVGDFVDAGGTVRVRFTTSDEPNDSITEAGIDELRVDALECAGGCPADLDDDGQVDGADLGLLLGSWNQGGAADLDGSGAVDGADLGLLLGAWGTCDG